MSTFLVAAREASGIGPGTGGGGGGAASGTGTVIAAVRRRGGKGGRAPAAPAEPAGRLARAPQLTAPPGPAAGPAATGIRNP